MDCLVGAKRERKAANGRSYKNRRWSERRHDGRQPKRHTGGRGAYPYAGRHDMKLYTLAKGISPLFVPFPSPFRGRDVASSRSFVRVAAPCVRIWLRAPYPGCSRKSEARPRSTTRINKKSLGARLFRHELWSTGRTPPSHLAAANQPRNHWALWTFVVAGDLGSTYWLNAARRPRWRTSLLLVPPLLPSLLFLLSLVFILRDFVPRLLCTRAIIFYIYIFFMYREKGINVNLFLLQNQKNLNLYTQNDMIKFESKQRTLWSNRKYCCSLIFDWIFYS